MKPIFSIFSALLALAWGANAPQSQARAAQIGFIAGGKLMVQSSAGGAVRAAKASQKTAWQRQAETYNRVSPDGKLRAEDAGNSSYERAKFRVVNAQTGAQVMSAEEVARVARPASDESNQGERFYRNKFTPNFAGWLPDSRHVAIMGGDANSSSLWMVRCVIDVKAFRMRNFNGWMSRQGTSLVAAPNGKIADNLRDPVGDGTTKLPAYSATQTYYAARLSQGLAAYPTGAKRRALLYNGQPFSPAMSTSFPYDAQDKLLVRFSRDGSLALCYQRNNFSDGGKNPSFLVNLSTGKVRQLGGTKAKFIY